MMTDRVVRRLDFCAGHRIYGHESKCAHLHGHNYRAELTAEGSQDLLGRVVDFSVLKHRFSEWIDEYWDHAFILFSEDKEALKAIRSLPGQRVFVMASNPTAENMARFLLLAGDMLLEGTGTRLVRVVLWETRNCYAEAIR